MEGTDMEKRSQSDSKVQRNIENELFGQIQKELHGTKLVANPLLHYKDNPKITIKPDFYSEEDQIIGEIHAHIGRLKPAQRHKIASDILKMISFEKDYGKKFKKYYVVCDEVEYSQLTKDSYLSETIKQFEVKVILLDLNDELHCSLRRAMEEQDLMKYEIDYEK